MGWSVLPGAVSRLAPSLMALAISPDRMNSLAASVAVPHRECPLCGMTRGYAEMARGDIRAAWEWNRGAPVLFMAGLLNGGAAAVYLVWCWRRRAGKGKQFSRVACRKGRNRLPLSLVNDTAEVLKRGLGSFSASCLFPVTGLALGGGGTE